MTNDSGRAWAERQVMVALAGAIAEQRALQGDAPGWRRTRSADQRLAFHESGHAVVAHALGWYCHEMTLDPDPGLKVESGASVAAYASVTSKPEWPAGSGKPTGVIASDRRTAATFCLVMAGDWRGALRRLSTLRETARELVEQNWQSIRFLADELERHRQLDQKQIESILGIAAHSGRG